MINKNQKEFTTSKKILWVSALLFILTVVLAVWFSYKGIDTSIFIYILPITGGILGCTIAFYMNKSKMENIFRFKITFLEYKLNLIKDNPKMASVIDKEMSSIEDSLDSKVDSTMQEAVDEDINIQSY